MRASVSRSMAAPLFLFLILREPYRTARFLHTRDLGLRGGRRVSGMGMGETRGTRVPETRISESRSGTPMLWPGCWVDGAAEAGGGRHGLWVRA